MRKDKAGGMEMVIQLIHTRQTIHDTSGFDDVKEQETQF